MGAAFERLYGIALFLENFFFVFWGLFVGISFEVFLKAFCKRIEAHRIKSKQRLRKNLLFAFGRPG